MDIDHGLAAVELLIDRGERGIAEILVLVAREQAYAVGLERVAGVFDLLQAALHVRRRNAGKQAEAAGMILDHRGAVLVELPREGAGLLDIVAVPDPGLGDGEAGRGNPALVHVLERQGRRPFRRRSAGAAARRVHGIDVELRDEVMVHVDPRLGGRFGRRRLRAARGMPATVAAAPRPGAATPPARKFRRAGLAGRADGSQHRQLRTSLWLMDLGLIPSLALYRYVTDTQTAWPSLAAVPALFQVSKKIARLMELSEQTRFTIRRKRP